LPDFITPAETWKLMFKITATGTSLESLLELIKFVNNGTQA